MSACLCVVLFLLNVSEVVCCCPGLVQVDGETHHDHVPSLHAQLGTCVTINILTTVNCTSHSRQAPQRHADMQAGRQTGCCYYFSPVRHNGGPCHTLP